MKQPKTKGIRIGKATNFNLLKEMISFSNRIICLNTVLFIHPIVRSPKDNKITLTSLMIKTFSTSNLLFKKRSSKKNWICKSKLQLEKALSLPNN